MAHRAVKRGAAGVQDGSVGARLPLPAAGVIVYAFLFGYVALFTTVTWSFESATTQVLWLAVVLSAVNAGWAMLIGFDAVRRLTDPARRAWGPLVVDAAALILVGMIQVAVSLMRASAS